MFSTRSIMPHENPYLQGVLSLVSLLTGGVSLTLSCKERNDYFEESRFSLM